MAGLRGTVRVRPPYPTRHGFLGRPTAVNNVETLAAVPAILADGGAANARLGQPPETGTLLVCLNELFARPGAYEVELGTPLRVIVEELGGGLKDSAELRALQVGGPLGGFLPPSLLDLPLLESALAAAGVSLGHGSLVAIDGGVSQAALLAHLWQFGAEESCGACTPCREGTRRGASDPMGTSGDPALAIAAISSARATNEENYLMQKLMRTVVGTNNVDNCSRICHAPSAAGLTAAFGLSGGTNPADDIERSDLFLLAGTNATEAHPVVGARIKQQVLRGARLVVVDPRRTELAALADVHLQARPGSNVAVFNGLARLLLEEGWADLDFLARRADGLDGLREVVSAYTPERVEQIAGIPPALLRTAARLYGSARLPTVFYGLGITEHAHGTDGVRTLTNLAILRGVVGTARGGGVNPLRGQNNVQGASDMGALPDLLPGYQRVTDEAARRRVGDAWGVTLPPVPGLRIPDMFAGALDGRVRALYVMGEDIAQTDPDSRHVRAAIDACELVISQEIFLSETARLADVVLPAGSFLEKDGTFVNFDRRFQRVRPALSPPGGARTDFDILLGVAAALGGDLGVSTSAEAMAECATVAPLFAGITHERLDQLGALAWPCLAADDPGEARLYQSRFETPNGRAQLAAVHWLPPGEQPDSAYPYTLITGRRLEHYNSGTMTRRTANLDLSPEEVLDMHPEDLARLGLGDGDRAAVASRRGEVVTRVRGSLAMAPGQAFMAFHFPEVAANALTSDVVDTVTSCPEYKVTAVSIRPVTASRGEG